MATAFTSLGVAGLLVAAFVPGLTGGAASAPTSERNGMEAMGAAGGPTAAAADDSVTPMAGAPQAPGASSISGPADLASTAPAFGAADGDDATGEGAGDGADPAGRLSSEIPQPNLLVIGSLALLLVGLAIFGLRAAARRVR